MGPIMPRIRFPMIPSSFILEMSCTAFCRFTKGCSTIIVNLPLDGNVAKP